MGTSLLGLTPAATYTSLLKTTDNSAISATSKYISDGAGNDSVLSLSTTKVGIGTSTPSVALQIVGSTFVNSGSSYGVNGLSIGDALSAAFLYYYSGGLYFKVTGTDIVNFTSSGAAIGTAGTQPTARLQIKGSGATSATTSLLVQNSASTTSLSVLDNGTTYIAGRLAVADGINLNNSNYYITSDLQFYSANTQNMVLSYGGGNVYGQFVGQLCVGSSSPNTSSKMDIQSTTQGFLPPRMTTAQKNAISSPAAGLMVYDTTLAKLCVYTSAWETITSI